MFSVYYALEAFMIEDVQKTAIKQELISQVTSKSFISEDALKEGFSETPQRKPRILKTKVFLKVVQPPLAVNTPTIVSINRQLKGLLHQSKGTS